VITHNTLVVVLGCAALGVAAGAVGCFALLRGRALLADAMGHASPD
jgi:manganese/zinc/iron transport system permease protein